MTGQAITGVFPNLAAVNGELYPDARAERPTIGEYATSLEAQGHSTPVVAEAIENARFARSHFDCVVYVAGGLTGVSEELKARYGATNKLLKSYGAIADDSETEAFFGYVPHLHGTDPVKHPNVTPQEVRDIDHLWSSVVADIHVNYLDPTAHGNAIEEGWAESALIPTIYLNPAGNNLSRLTKGMHNVIETIEYEDFETSTKPHKKSALESLQVTFDELYKWMAAFPERDPREFHYNSFARLANPVAAIGGHAVQAELGIADFQERFDAEDFAVYSRVSGDTYGKIGRIAGMHEQTGIIVITEDGQTRLFDPLLMRALSFWPVDRQSYLAKSLQAVKASELPDPE